MRDICDRHRPVIPSDIRFITLSEFQNMNFYFSAALVQVYAITVLQDNRLIEGDTCPAETPLAASINTTQSSITV